MPVLPLVEGACVRAEMIVEIGEDLSPKRVSMCRRASACWIVSLAAALVANLTLASPAFPQRARASSTRTLAIRVKAFEFGFTLSAKAAPLGTVTFIIKNTGLTAHDFRIDGRRSAIIQSGQTGRLTVRFVKPGKYPYRCTIDHHAWGGMKGTFTIR